MDFQHFKQQISDYKASHSCADFLSSHGFPASEGQSIRTPSFIRSGDTHPSFAVYNSHCKDYATNTSYDIFSLDMLLHNRTFLQSVQFLTGLSLSSDPEAQPGLSRAQNNLEQLRQNVLDWHNALLLDDDALEYLHNRKISDETINNFLIGYNPQAKRIIIPYFRKEHGHKAFLPAYYVSRDITGTVTGSGKYMKAKTSWGISNLPWGLNTLRTSKAKTLKYTGIDGEEYDTQKPDPKDTTLIIVEGTIDALVFAQEGWQVLSPCGGNFPHSQRPFIFDTCRQYERVFICFDNDPRGEQFRQEWTKLLFQHRIPFVCGHTAPAGKKADKLDVADYYCAGNSLDDLVANAENGIVEYSRSLRTYEDIAEAFTSASMWADPLDLDMLKASLIRRWTQDGLSEEGTPIFRPVFDKKRINYLFTECTKGAPDYMICDSVLQKHNLKYNAGDSFYEYTQGLWKAVPDIFVEQYILRELGRKSTARKNTSVMRYMQQYLAEHLEFDTKPVLTLENCALLLDEKNSAGRFGRITSHSPEHMCTIRVPVRYDPQAKCSRWVHFIREVTGGDKTLMRLLQKAAGYVLFPGNSMQKFFYLIGAGANGKSTFLQILSEVFGTENGSYVRPDRMGDQFAPMAMKGKLYNICYEANAYMKGSEESMKAIVSSDTIMAAHKGVDAVAFKPRAKVFVASNTFFNARDVSWGFLRRIIFLPFEQIFDPETPEAQSLMGELRAELPGIFSWCLEGFRMLAEDQGFEETAKQKEYMERFVEQIDPITAFYREKLSCSIKEAGEYQQGESMFSLPDNRYPSDTDLYRFYTMWCKDNGHKAVCKAFFREKLASAAKSAERFNGLRRIECHKSRNRYLFVFHELDESLDDSESLALLASLPAEPNKAEAERQEVLLDVSDDVIEALRNKGSSQGQASPVPNAPEDCSFTADKLDPSYVPSEAELEDLLILPADAPSELMAELVREGARIYDHIMKWPADFARMTAIERWRPLEAFIRTNPLAETNLAGYRERRHTVLMNLWRERVRLIRREEGLNR